jgi:hypothetical protein
LSFAVSTSWNVLIAHVGLIPFETSDVIAYIVVFAVIAACVGGIFVWTIIDKKSK